VLAVGLSIRPIWPWPVLLVLAAVLVVAAVVGYRHTTRPLSRSRKSVLLTLRMLAIGIGIVVLARPACTVPEIKRQKAVLAILIDETLSMSIQDEANKVSRAEAAADAYRQCEPILKKMGRKLEIQIYGFGQKLKPLVEIGSAPTLQATAMGYALSGVLRNNEGRPVAAVIIVGDGGHNWGPSPGPVAVRYGRQKIPVYTIAFGKETASASMRDIVVQDLRAARTIFVKNKLAVTADFDVRGFKGVKVPVNLQYDGKLVDTQIITPSTADEQVRVELEHIPTEPGEHKITISVPVQKGELLDTNNVRSRFVSVLEGGLRVVLIPGKVRPETTFLRRTLADSPIIRLESTVPASALGGRGRPVLDLDDLGARKVDVYIIGDVPRDRFSQQERDFIIQAVNQGAGLLAMGGLDAFGPGGWGQRRPGGKSMADVLPVTMKAADGQMAGDVKVVPTRRGLAHYVMRIGPDPSAAWKELLPMNGASRIGRKKELAMVLAQDEAGTPLLVTHTYGAGRVMAFGGDTTFQWYLNSLKTKDYHKRFWRQVILWLARMDEAGRKRVWIKIEPIRAFLGQRVEITAGVRDDQGNPVADAQLTATVLKPDAMIKPGEEAGALELAAQGDQWTGTFSETDAPGDYLVQVTATVGGEALGPAQARFEVYTDSLELSNPKANLPVMRGIAKDSGGKFGRGEDLKRFLEELESKDLSQKYAVMRRVELWDNFVILAIFVGLIGMEWVIRKRRGLV